MLTRIKTFSKSFLQEMPIAGELLRRRSFQRQLQRRFRVEVELIKGIHDNTNRHQSILHFSVNKAATQYVKEILRRCAFENGMVHASFHDYAFHGDLPFLDHLSAIEMQKYQHIFKPNGYLYSVFGGMIEEILELEKYLIVLMVRDPRDVLVSRYFSDAYSHAIPDRTSPKVKIFKERRRLAQQVPIDEYVIDKSDLVCSIYQRYIDHLLRRENLHVYITKYEDMICDFQSWLERLLEYCELKIDDRLLESLLQESEMLRPKQEDIHQHLRKGMPGDYKNKLMINTIDYLNSKFSIILKEFNYL